MSREHHDLVARFLGLASPEEAERQQPVPPRLPFSFPLSLLAVQAPLKISDDREVIEKPKNRNPGFHDSIGRPHPPSAHSVNDISILHRV